MSTTLSVAFTSTTRARRGLAGARVLTSDSTPDATAMTPAKRPLFFDDDALSPSSPSTSPPSRRSVGRTATVAPIGGSVPSLWGEVARSSESSERIAKVLIALLVDVSTSSCGTTVAGTPPSRASTSRTALRDFSPSTLVSFTLQSVDAPMRSFHGGEVSSSAKTNALGRAYPHSAPEKPINTPTQLAASALAYITRRTYPTHVCPTSRSSARLGSEPSAMPATSALFAVRTVVPVAARRASTRKLSRRSPGLSEVSTASYADAWSARCARSMRPGVSPAPSILTRTTPPSLSTSTTVAEHASPMRSGALRMRFARGSSSEAGAARFLVSADAAAAASSASRVRYDSAYMCSSL